jgi:hypothetical protein
MTGPNILDLIRSAELQQGLQEISCYLASIKQERPIVYLIAKCLWQRRQPFLLEEKKVDLTVNGSRIEFKFDFDPCEEFLKRARAKHGDNFEAICEDRGTSWSVAPGVFKDICGSKKPAIFVWIICSRDLTNVADDALDRICDGPAQCRFNLEYGFLSDGTRLTCVDWLLDALSKRRPFRLFKEDITTAVEFPSMYHFKICEFEGAAPAGGRAGQ